MKTLKLLSIAAIVLSAGLVSNAEADHRYRQHHYAPRSYGVYAPRPGPGPRVYYRGYRGRPYGYSRYGYSHRRHHGVYINLFGVPSVVVH